MKQDEAELVKLTAGGMLKEHLDGYVLVGYTADRHKRIVVCDFGADPSCADGLQIMSVAAELWSGGGLRRPADGRNDDSGAAVGDG